VDAIMYLMNVLIERGHGAQAIRKIKNSADDKIARNVLREKIQPVVSALMTDDELNRLVGKLRELPAPAVHNLLTVKDLLAGLWIFLLVFLCTLPVALPFALFSDVALAMRSSNGVALVLLLSGGFVLARYAGFQAVVTSVVYALIGMSLVALTMALGG
jgi:hypothetical protein